MIKFDTIRKSTIQFLNIFNNIKVYKYNIDDTVNREITVPLKLAGKQKFYYWLYHGEQKTKKYPMMAAAPKSFSPAIGERGKNRKLTFTNTELSKVIKPPVPYNIEFELNFVTNYIDEANQILSQILPFFDPYVMTTINVPEIGLKYDMKVILNSANQDLNFEMPEDQYRTFSWTLDFTAHTYFFKPIYDSDIIETIFHNYIDIGGNEDTALLERHKITEEEIIIYNYEYLQGLE